MKTKLVTVCWSTTVEIELPDGVGVNELESFDSPKDIRDIASQIVQGASDNLSLKDGVITDVQDYSLTFGANKVSS